MKDGISTCGRCKKDGVFAMFLCNPKTLRVWCEHCGEPWRKPAKRRKVRR